MSIGRKLTLGFAIFLGILGIFCLAIWLFLDWGHLHDSTMDSGSDTTPELVEGSRTQEPNDASSLVTKPEIVEEPIEEPNEAMAPLLTGRVHGETGDIVDARVILFSVRKVETIIRRLERFDPGSGLPDIPGLIAAVKNELRRFRSAGIEAKSNAKGIYAFYDIPIQPYFILTTASGHVFRYGDVTSIVAGQTTTLDLELDRGALISGKVVDEWEEGVPGVVVTAEYRPPGMQGVGKIVQKLLGYVNGEFLKGPFQSTTAEDGTFRLDSLPPAVYDLLAEKQGLPAARLEAIATGTSEAVILLVPGARVKGVLYDIRAGHPARGVPITLAPEQQALSLPFPGASDIAKTVERIIGEPELETVSATDGSFHFENIGSGRFKLALKTPGYLPLQRDVEVPSNQRALDLGTISVDTGGILTGWVRASGGAPVDAGTVTVVPSGMTFLTMGGTLNDMVSGRTTVSTDSNGYFKISGLAEGKYSVLAQARGYGSASKNDVEADGEPIELALEPGVTIRGLVVVAGTETGLSGVRVRAAGVFTRTDDEGQFTLEGVAPRNGRAMNPFAGMREFRNRRRRENTDRDAEIARDDEPDTPAPIRIRASTSDYQDESRTVKLSEVDREVVIELTPKARVLGVALDPSGELLPGTLVRLIPGGARKIPFLPEGSMFVAVGVSNIDGEFTLAAPDDDAEYSVLASHPLYASSYSEPFKALEANTDQSNESRVEVRLALGGTVQGIVTDGSQAIPGARVRLSEYREVSMRQRMFTNMLGLPKQGTMAYTMKDGRYSYERMLPGEYVVSAEVAGFPEKSTARFTLSENQTSEVNIVLDPGGAIVGETISQDGEPIGAARIRIIKQSGPDRMLRVQRMFGGAFKSSVSNGTGAFAASGLPAASRYTVIAEKRGFTSATVTDVDPDDPPLELILAAEARIEGKVIDVATGAPLHVYEFRVVATEPGPSSKDDERAWFRRAYKQVNDSDGRFSKNKLETGRYSVEVRANTYAPVSQEVILQPGDVKEVTIAMETAGVLVGKVLDAETGQPIVGARIALAPAPEEPVDESSETNDATSRDSRAATRDYFEHVMLGDSVYSEKDGGFTLDTFPLEPQTVLLTHEEYVQEYRDDIEVTLGEELEMTVRMKKGLSISGTAVKGPGEPVTEGFILLQGLSDNVRRTQKGVMPDGSGKFRIGGLEAGVYSITLTQRSSEDGQPVIQSVEVGEENVEGISLVTGE